MNGFEFVTAIRGEGNVRRTFNEATCTREELAGEIRSAMRPPRAAAG